MLGDLMYFAPNEWSSGRKSSTQSSRILGLSRVRADRPGSRERNQRIGISGLGSGESTFKEKEQSAKLTT
jgi:hypothetical protein